MTNKPAFLSLRHLINIKKFKILSTKNIDHDAFRSVKILYCFIYSGYNNNEDYTSWLGMVIGLIDKDKTFHFLHWSSTKCHQTTRSILASETYAFSFGSHNAISIKFLLKSLGIIIPLYVFADSKSTTLWIYSIRDSISHTITAKRLR